jgi:membrane-associated protein
VTTLALGPSWLDPNALLDNFGIWGLLLIVFAESGLLIGFFLPGDSLLFTAGLLAATGTIQFNVALLVALLIVCAFVGNQVGYFIGRKAGPALFNRPDSRLFKRENVDKAHRFFEKHGGMALVLARFVPIVRTFVPVIVGVAGMQRRRFVLFNAVGAVLWAGGVTTLGYILGDRVPWVQENLDVIFIVIVLISVVPLIIEFLKGYTARRKGRNNSDAR